MKIIKLYILLMFFALLFQSCATYKIEHIVGKYEFQGYDAKYELNLYNDSCFIFNLSAGLSQDTIHGRWNIKRNQLLLKANEYKPYYEISLCSTCNQYSLSSLDVDIKKDITVFYKAFSKNILKKEGMTDIHGNASFSEDIDSLYVESLEYKPLGFKVSENKSNIKVFLTKAIKNPILQYKWHLNPNEIKCSSGLILKKATNSNIYKHTKK